MTNKLYGNRWQIVKQIGEGGQGHIYLVEDVENAGKQYVLKRLKNNNRLGRFRDEIEALKHFDHHSVVKLIDYNIEVDKPYLVTEYCEEGELSQDKIKAFSLIDRLHLFIEICHGVGYIHQNGRIHRDIKPPNILFRENSQTPVIADFGICFNTEAGFERQTQSMEQAGSRFFMAPELADGLAENVTPAADVYSLGKLLYWILTGKIFDRETQNGVKKYNLGDFDIREFGYARYADFVDEIFDKSIVENPAERFADANALVAEVSNTMEIVEKGGRYLDATLDHDCLFCGIGKYSQKEIYPKIKRSEKSDPLGTAYFDLSYGTGASFVGQSPHGTIQLPEGNISTESYDQILMLGCDHCGNTQVFKNPGNVYGWKNTSPEIS